MELHRPSQSSVPGRSSNSLKNRRSWLSRHVAPPVSPARTFPCVVPHWEQYPNLRVTVAEMKHRFTARPNLQQRSQPSGKRFAPVAFSDPGRFTRSLALGRNTDQAVANLFSNLPIHHNPLDHKNGLMRRLDDSSFYTITPQTDLVSD
jgi:hypothetical protein